MVSIEAETSRENHCSSFVAAEPNNETTGCAAEIDNWVSNEMSDEVVVKGGTVFVVVVVSYDISCDVHCGYV